MWFIFPQLKGLGFSQRADEFAISSREEAQAYLDHLVLGPRLIQCTQLVIEIDGFKISEIFGYPDYLKFRSCMTLFSIVNPEEPVFRQALQKYFGGELDPRTVARL